MKEPIELVIKYYGCKDKADLQSYLGDDISVRMLETLVTKAYSEILSEVLLILKKNE